MPYAESFEKNVGAWITEPEPGSGDYYLHVLVEDPSRAFRFKIDFPTLGRLNVECAAKIVSHLQRGEAYIKTPDGSVMIVGPRRV